MLENIPVQQCMTHPAMTVGSSMSVRLAQQLMRDYHIRHLPVVDNNRLVGILSSGDIRRASPSNATSLSVWEMRALWEQLKVDAVMSHRVISVTPETSMLEAVRLMYEHRFNSLPVVDDSGHVVGILTEVDVFLQIINESEQAAAVSAASSGYPAAVLP
jgi:CBS domain-containing protein